MLTTINLTFAAIARPFQSATRRVAAVVVAAAASAATVAAVSFYVATDLETLGGASSFPLDAGVVVGYSDPAPGGASHASDGHGLVAWTTLGHSAATSVSRLP